MLLEWWKKKSFPHCHINEPQSCDLLSISQDSARLSGWDHHSRSFFSTSWIRYIWIMETQPLVLIAASLLLHKAKSPEWPTCTNDQISLTWNSEAATLMLVEYWEFPRFFSSQFPIIVSWGAFYCNKWFNRKIPSETSSCTFPDTQSFCSEEPKCRMTHYDLTWVYVTHNIIKKPM